MSAKPGSSRISRRDFVKMTTAFIWTLIGAGIGIPMIGYLFSPALRAQEEDNTWISLGPLENYPIGMPTPFSFMSRKTNGWENTAINHKMYVVRKNEEQVRVFSVICTHLGCHVTWHPDIQDYVSPCHDGHFDIMGRNISGPPPRPLDEFITKLENGNLFVTLPPFKRTA
ncbi:MAG: ubiquinol-cytochrome c reductase iron-sulfur subunit [Chloroflexota bacterium]